MMNDQKFLKQLVEGIKRRRKANGLTQDTLAQKAGVSVATIKKIETGSGLTLNTLRRIYKALGESNRLEMLIIPDSLTTNEIFENKKRKIIPQMNRGNPNREGLENILEKEGLEEILIDSKEVDEKLKRNKEGKTLKKS